MLRFVTILLIALATTWWVLSGYTKPLLLTLTPHPSWNEAKHSNNWTWFDFLDFDLDLRDLADDLLDADAGRSLTRQEKLSIAQEGDVLETYRREKGRA